jgi:hypothetical protein
MGSAEMSGPKCGCLNGAHDQTRVCSPASVACIPEEAGVACVLLKGRIADSLHQFISWLLLAVGGGGWAKR